MKTDYEVAIEQLNGFPAFVLGEEVDTKFGRGILIKMNIPANGLHIKSELARCMVWYGCDNDSNGWVQHEFYITEIEHSKRVGVYDKIEEGETIPVNKPWSKKDLKRIEDNLSQYDLTDPRKK